MKRTIAILLSLVMLFSVGCSNNKTIGDAEETSEDLSSETSEELSSDTSTQSDETEEEDDSPKWGAASNELTVISPLQAQMTTEQSPTFKWKKLKNATSYSLKVEEYVQGKFKTAFEKGDITTTKYKHSEPLKVGGIYRFSLQAKVGEEVKKAKNIPADGAVFMNWVDYKNHPANSGMDFSIKNSVSEKVLNNYLSRSMGNGLLNFLTDDEIVRNCSRMILNTGAKYIARANSVWLPAKDQENLFPKMKAAIDNVHSIDPDVVFEACIFETCWSGINSFQIPAWVFEAFGKTPVSRTFNYQQMLFSDGKYKNKFGDGISVPDITKEETQMFIYYRACMFIDVGFEALHMGQEPLVGANDTHNRDYAKVFKMIRKYAKDKARRGFVFINAHSYPFDMRGPDNELLLDFAAQPSCVYANPSDTPHLPTESQPQEAAIRVGNGIYKNSPGGVTPSGWNCQSQAYFVEFDNFMTEVKSLDQFKKPGNGKFAPWGFDEISWFANQPTFYRQKFLKYIYETVQSYDANGHFEVPGFRTAYLISSQKQEDYLASSKIFSSKGSDDEETIKQLWINNKK